MPRSPSSSRSRSRSSSDTSSGTSSGSRSSTSSDSSRSPSRSESRSRSPRHHKRGRSSSRDSTRHARRPHHRAEHHPDSAGQHHPDHHYDSEDRHDRHPARTVVPQTIVVPTLPQKLAKFLDLVATHVARGGLPVEDALREREADNKYFAFLDHADWRNPMQVYYRWRVYSLLQGDTLREWRTDEFQMQAADGLTWRPPPLPGQDVEASAKAKKSPLTAKLEGEKVRTDALPAALRREWVAMLGAIVTPDRGAIGEAMLFAIDNCQWAFDIIELTIHAIGLRGAAAELNTLQKSTADLPQAEAETLFAAVVNRVLARLFLLSDIVMNTYAKVDKGSESPRVFLKVLDALVPVLYAHATLMVVELYGGQAPAPPGGGGKDVVANVAARSAPWAVIGWLQDLLAMWKVRGAGTPGLAATGEKQCPWLDLSGATAS